MSTSPLLGEPVYKAQSPDIRDSTPQPVQEEIIQKTPEQYADEVVGEVAKVKGECMYGVESAFKDIEIAYNATSQINDNNLPQLIKIATNAGYGNDERIVEMQKYIDSAQSTPPRIVTLRDQIDKEVKKYTTTGINEDSLRTAITTIHTTSSREEAARFLSALENLLNIGVDFTKVSGEDTENLGIEVLKADDLMRRTLNLLIQDYASFKKAEDTLVKEQSNRYRATVDTFIETMDTAVTPLRRCGDTLTGVRTRSHQKALEILDRERSYIESKFGPESQNPQKLQLTDLSKEELRKALKVIIERTAKNEEATEHDKENAKKARLALDKLV